MRGAWKAVLLAALLIITVGYSVLWAVEARRRRLAGRATPDATGLGIGFVTNFFDTLGIKPLLGRAFLPGEEKGAAPVLLLSYNFWQKSFAGDPNVVGQVFQRHLAASVFDLRSSRDSDNKLVERTRAALA